MEEGANDENSKPLSLEPKEAEEVKQVTQPKEEDLSKKDTSKMTKKERKQH